MTTNRIQDKFRGCLLGQALGDAVGFLAETWTAEQCRRFMATSYADGTIAAHTRDGYRFGQYSDDTQMAREVVSSLIACRGFDPADLARRIAALFYTGRIVGPGKSSRAAAQRLLAGVPWSEAGEPAPAAGNGSAMRAAPFGLAFDDVTALIAAARTQAMITHQDQRCADGAAIVALATRFALGWDELGADAFVWGLDHQLGTLAPESRAGLTLLRSVCGAPIDEALHAIADLDPTRLPRWQHISPYVLSTVLWALYSFLSHPDDYNACLTTAVSGGGDVDTVAAIAGALSGARLGYSNLPQRDLGRLNDAGAFGEDELIDLADHLYELRGILFR